MTQEVKGGLLAVAGVLVISPDALLVRLMDLDQWTIIFGRGVLSCLGLTTVVAVVARRQRTTIGAMFAAVGRPGVVMAVISAVANLLFVVSLTNTHVANTLVMFAASPLLAAVLSHVFLRERIAAATWWASGGALVAIGVIFSRSLESGGLGGDIAALTATILLAVNLTIVRSNRNRSMVPALAGSGALSALAVIGLVDLASIGARDAALLVVDGYVVVPLALSMLMIAPRYIPAPDVALIHLLEVILGPLWVWMVIGEVPPVTTVVGGVVLLTMLVVHTTRQMSRSRLAISE